MPPPEKSDKALADYLTRLMAALCLERNGELRIPRALIRKVAEAGARQLLCEDTNTETDELVLRFGTKNSAVYVVEPECPISKPAQPATTSQTVSPPPSQGRPPLTPEQERALEQVMRYNRVKARMNRERRPETVTAQSELSEILGSNSTS